MYKSLMIFYFLSSATLTLFADTQRYAPPLRLATYDLRLPTHDFHNSIAEVNYRAKNQTFEVSLRVFTDDFELALARLGGVKVLTLDKTKKHEALIKQYITAHFYCTDAKKQKILPQYVGKELENEVVWIYFEIPLKKSPKGWQIYNSILTELYDDQTNMVNVIYKAARKTLLFRRGEVSGAMGVE
jgi:hypothetical protein